MKSFVTLISTGIMVLCLSVNPCFAQSSGSIVGTVLDPSGNPLGDVTVIARSIVRARNETRLSAQTDVNGHFSIANCPFGGYLLLATEDHPERPGMSPVSQKISLFTTIALLPRIPVANVSFKFGRDTGVLTGKIRDKSTGQPVIANLQVKSVASATYWLASAVPPEFRIQLPTTDDVVFIVSAPGYQPWSYPSSASDSSLHLQLGAKKNFDVLLQPLR